MKPIKIIGIFFPVMLLTGTLVDSVIASQKEDYLVVADEDDAWTYVDELSGDYTISPSNGTHKGKYLDISGGKAATTSNAPALEFYAASSPVQANHRFSFIRAGVSDGKTVFNITSPFDNHGKLDIKSGILMDQQPIWFYANSNLNAASNNAERFFIEKNVDGQYRISSAANNTFYLCVSSGTGTPKLVISDQPSEENSLFDLKLVAGDYGLGSSLYLIGDNTGYSISGAAPVERFLNPNNDGAPKVSKMVSFSISADDMELTTFNNVKALKINYGSKFYAYSSFLYANPAYGTWTSGLGLSANANDSYGESRPWRLSSDSASFTDIKGRSSNVGLGQYGIQYSYDKATWKDYALYSGATKTSFDKWEIDLKDFAYNTGVYFRFIFRFEIVTNHYHKTDWFGLFHDTSEEWKNVIQVSEPFFVGQTGFGEETFGVISVKNLTTSEDVADVESYSANIGGLEETLKDGSFTSTGFKIERLYKSYKVEVSYNDGDYVLHTSDDTIYDKNGKYDIKVTSCWGEEKEETILVASDFTKAYFGKPFASVGSEEGTFISGQRILSGSNDILKKYGIVLPYSGVTVPVYKNGVTLTTQDLTNLPSLTGILVKNNGEKEVEDTITFDTKNTTYEFLEEGYYQLALRTTNEIGDVVTATFEWYITDDDTGPAINEQLLALSQESYDLNPIYYSVRMNQGPFLFSEDGEMNQKQKSLYFAFGNYYDALAFALKLEKQYVVKVDENQYRYENAKNNNVIMNEFDTFTLMYEKAKENVAIRYFSNSNTYTTRGINLSTEELGEFVSNAYSLNSSTNGGDISLIVTEGNYQLSNLTSRMPFINNFVFLKAELDSETVELIDEEDNVYPIEYGVPVGSQLLKANAKNGKYTVKETNIYGETSEYEVYYIKEASNGGVSDAKIHLYVDDTEYNLDYMINGATLHAERGFRIEDVSNPNDDHAFMVITHSKFTEDVYLLSDIKERMVFAEEDTYLIHIEDRMGNSFEFTVKVGE